MGNNLRKLRDSSAWTQQKAADAMGISRSSYIKLERGERKLNEETIRLASLAFEVDRGEIVGDIADVPIVGIAGADPNGLIAYTNTDGELGRAPMPPGGNEHTVAVEVRGTSMRGIAEDGWLIYYDDVRSPLTNDMIGELCILWLEDGRVLIKKPYRSHAPGKYDLESSSADTLREQDVVSAAFVTFLAPARTARLMIKRAS